MTPESLCSLADFISRDEGIQKVVKTHEDRCSFWQFI